MSKQKSSRIPHPIWFGILAVLMVVLWVYLAVLLPYHREQIVTREIERLGGEVYTNWSGPEWVWDGPEWLQKIVGDGWLSWFDRVVYVDLAETAINDEGLKYLNKHLKGLMRLIGLRLNDTQVGDDGLKHLISGLTNLRQLNVSNTLVSDKGLKHLNGLTNPHILLLENTQISDGGLKHLCGLKTLSLLSLENTQVTKEGVIELQKALPDCEISY